jgi:ketosteroid isomerase-like protein
LAVSSLHAVTFTAARDGRRRSDAVRVEGFGSGPQAPEALGRGLAPFSPSEGATRRPASRPPVSTPRGGFSSVPAVEHAARLRAVYAAFNARDLDVLLEQMTADVDWPNAWQGGRVHGHEEVRDYWSRQWSVSDPSVEPVALNVRPDGRVAVAVDQAVRGAVLAEGRVVHVYTFRDGLIARMDVEESARD